MKYIIMSDLKYISTKKMSEIKKYMFIKVILILFYYFNNIIFIESLLGLNLNIKSVEIISLFPYLINTIFDYYIIIKIIEKDMQYMYSIIFTRIKVSNWLLSKIISYILIVAIIKMLEYSIVAVLFGFNNVLLHYYLLELFYGLIIETIVIFCYLFRQKKVVFSLLLILSFILIPKTLLALKRNVYLIIIVSVIINCVIFLFSSHKNNSFFYLVGGAYDKNK